MSRWASVALSLLFVPMAAVAAEPELTGALKRFRDTGVISVGFSDGPVPFSYYDNYRNVVGYSIDICKKVTDAIKAEIKKPELKVEMRPIKSDDALSYINSGVIDIHCGPILNTWPKKGRVDFGPTYFVQRFRFASHESAHMSEMSDMQGKRLIVAQGTPALASVQQLNATPDFSVTVVPAMSVDDAFRMFREDAGQALVADEVTLAQGMARNWQLDPSLVTMSAAAWGAEPYSFVYLKGDAPLKTLITNTMQQYFKSGAVKSVYAKWFTSPIPREGISLGLPISDPLERVFSNPTDLPDAALYK